MFYRRHSVDKRQAEKAIDVCPTEEPPNPDSPSADQPATDSTEATNDSKLDAIQEPKNKEEEEEEEKEHDEEKKENDQVSHHRGASASDLESNLMKYSEEVDTFLSMISDDKNDRTTPPEIPQYVEIFANLVQVEIVKCVSGDISSFKLFDETDDEPSILDSIDKISKLTTLLGDYQEKEIVSLVNLTSTVLQRAMAFIEEEFRTIIDVPPSISNAEVGSKRSTNPDFSVSKRSSNSSFNDRCALSNTSENTAEEEEESFPGYSMETITNLKKIAAAMIASGYQTECCQVYNLARKNAFDDKLNRLGFEKISIDDVQKMSWESLEGEIVTWIKVTKQAVAIYFPSERKLCEQVFAENLSLSRDMFHKLTRNIALQLLNFAEAVAMTKRSAEKLFKFLDMYETLRDVISTLEELFGDDSSQDMKSEIQMAQSRLGEAAVAIFCDLENSIKSDTGKTPVPGGAVHPLTRYTINYVKYACEYKDTLEHIFKGNRENMVHVLDSTSPKEEKDDQPAEDEPSPFSEQLMAVMDLLDSNLEGKSKLYKDPSQNYIFLMNNGRYIMQKIKESPEMSQLLGTTWSRKKSSDLRQYHKNYRQETWSKVLGCLNHEGLQVNGKVQKPVLKERFKSFNAMFDEILRTQSTWVVSDPQLQSELRVSIGAVVIPAYRSFLGRFEQYLDAGRQTEKYIKFNAEDIETCIDDLFNGNQSIAARKKP